MKKKIISLLLVISLFAAQGYCADKAIVYDDTNRKVKVSDPLPYSRGGTGISSVSGQASKVIRVKSNESGYELVTLITIPSGVIVMWSGSITSIPSSWALCDGNNGTPDLRDKFIVCAKQDEGGVAKTNITGSLTQSGGSINISEANLPSHTHGAGTLVVANESAHTHILQLQTTSGGSGGPGAQRSDFSNTVTQTTGAGSAHTHTLSGSTGAIGSGTAFTQPYYALAYIMKL